MSVVLETSGPLTEHPATSIHHIPCKIESRGQAKVSEYFKPGIRTDSQDSDLLKASFRGRPLEGRTIEVPTGFTGLTVNRQEVGNPEGKVNLKVSGKFSSFTYWNLDQTPSSNDKLVQALKWLEVSSVIHSPQSDISASQSSCQPSQ